MPAIENQSFVLRVLALSGLQVLQKPAEWPAKVGQRRLAPRRATG
jgi:hypothetical protein